MLDAKDATRPIVGIENRTGQEVFDIMCDRFRRAPQAVGPEPVAQISDKLVDTVRETYRRKVAEYDRDFRDPAMSGEPWNTKYGTNLHSTSLGEKWAMSQALRSALVATPPRPCTCHPDDNPPTPCAEKYALGDCHVTPPAERVVDADAVREALLDAKAKLRMAFRKALSELPEIAPTEIKSVLSSVHMREEFINEGKRLQLEHGTDAVAPRVEQECGAGAWSFMRSGVLTALAAKDGRS